MGENIRRSKAYMNFLFQNTRQAGIGHGSGDNDNDDDGKKIIILFL